MTTGKRLKEEREKLGFNQTAFAAIGGVGRKSQFNYEDDERKPDSDYLAAIAAIGADVRYIVTGDREGPPPLSPEEQLMLDRYRASSRSLKDAALRVLLGGETSAENGTKSQPAAHAGGTFNSHGGQQINAPVKGVVVGRDFVNQGRKKKRETGDQQ